MNDKVVFINGFEKDDVFKIMRAVKSACGQDADIAFAMGTENNRRWVVEDMLAEVRSEHEYMKNQQKN